MNRELYIYWKLAPRNMASATANLQRWHEDLRTRHPGLRVRVLSRADSGQESPSQSTLMEIYQTPGGIDAKLQALIESEGAQVTAAWCQDLRHVEVFEPLRP